MKRFLPAVLLSLIFVVPCHAQTLQAAALRQVNPPSQPGPSPQPAMTPRQIAEMRADILFARKLYSQAVSAYLAIEKEAPKDALLQNKLGEVYEQELNHGRAEHWFKEAIKTDKNFASAYNNVGTVEFAKHHYKNAIDWYDKTLRLQPDASVEAPTYCNMGYAYFAWKKFPEAIGAFQQAIALDPQIMTEHGSSGSILQQREASNYGEFYFFMAGIYAQAGNAERTAHYLKMSRDIGYTKFVKAKTDPVFTKVIKDPRVQAVFLPVPELTSHKD